MKEEWGSGLQKINLFLCVLVKSLLGQTRNMLTHKNSRGGTKSGSSPNWHVCRCNFNEAVGRHKDWVPVLIFYNVFSRNWNVWPVLKKDLNTCICSPFHTVLTCWLLNDLDTLTIHFFIYVVFYIQVKSDIWPILVKKTCWFNGGFFFFLFFYKQVGLF